MLCHATNVYMSKRFMSTDVSDRMFTILNMGAFIDRLKEAITAKNLTERQARSAFSKLGMTRSNLTHWFTGRATNPRIETVVPVADFLGVSAVWLATGVGQKDQRSGVELPANNALPADALPAPKGRVVWVVGACQGGIPERIWDDGGQPVGATDEYTEVATDDPNAFVCRVVGDSMAPRYQPGEYALVEPNTQVEIEDDVLVRLVTGETMLKRLVSRRGGYRFDSHRPGEPTLTYRDAEVAWVYHVAHPIQARKIRMHVDAPTYRGPDRRVRDEPVEVERWKRWGEN